MRRAWASADLGLGTSLVAAVAGIRHVAGAPFRALARASGCCPLWSGQRVDPVGGLDRPLWRQGGRSRLRDHWTPRSSIGAVYPGISAIAVLAAWRYGCAALIAEMNFSRTLMCAFAAAMKSYPVLVIRQV